jgi:hypothetical protein
VYGQYLEHYDSVAHTFARTNRYTGSIKSRAGFNDCGCEESVQSRRYKSDMKNLEQSHGSPKFAIKMDRTPSPVGGNEEKLGSICDIIGLWEGMEGKEGGKEEPEG